MARVCAGLRPSLTLDYVVRVTCAGGAGQDRTVLARCYGATETPRAVLRDREKSEDARWRTRGRTDPLSQGSHWAERRSPRRRLRSVSRVKEKPVGRGSRQREARAAGVATAAPRQQDTDRERERETQRHSATS